METLVLPARRLGPADEEWAALLLAEAYAADPAYLTLWGPEPFAPLLSWMRLLVRYTLRAGCGYASPGGKAVALWLPAHAAALTWGGLLRVGPGRLAGLGLGVVQKLLRGHRTQDEWQQHSLPVAHHRLLALGVRPGNQRRGEGRNLLRATVAAVGGRYLPCCALTQQSAALRFGQRLGFEVVGRAPLPAPAGAELTAWLLVRPAAPI